MDLVSRSMVYFLLKGQRNLSLAKAKIMGKRTGTDPMVWIDPARVLERREAWSKTFGKIRRGEK